MKRQACSCGPECDCGCCQGTEPLTPLDIASRPGLDALSYRVGTHSSFLETMKAGLSSEALFKLTTRDGSDPAIAWLDAWAVVADVLTFYQERIANEGFLRTATERRSVLELARLVGYEPRPGVAAPDRASGIAPRRRSAGATAATAWPRRRPPEAARRRRAPATGRSMPDRRYAPSPPPPGSHRDARAIRGRRPVPLHP